MLVVRRVEQQLRGVRRTARDDDDVAGDPLLAAVPLDDDLGDGRAGVVRVQLDHLRVRQQRDVRVLERRPHAEHLGVGLGVHQAGEAVAVRAAHARAVRHVRLVEHDAARRVERVVAGRGELVRRAAGCAARARRPGAGTARSRAARSDPRRALRAPGRAARPACSTAPSRRRRSARPARCRRGGAAPRSPPGAAGRARRRTAWSRRRRSSGSAAGTLCRSRRTTCRARRSGCRRRRPRRASSAARAAASRRARAAGSASRMAPERASVPPPAPVPMMMTS